MNNKEITLPKWFKGMVYDKGEVVKNLFSGESYMLNGVELSMYDFIIGSQYLFEVAPKSVTSSQVDDFHKALNWFRKNNVEAYMVLLD